MLTSLFTAPKTTEVNGRIYSSNNLKKILLESFIIPSSLLEEISF